MKSGRIYRQYQWIIKTLLGRDGITFDEMSRRWMEVDVSDRLHFDAVGYRLLSRRYAEVMLPLLK